jgi:hypothetical protein
LVLFPPDFSQICQGLVNLIYFFQEPAVHFIGSLYVFFSLYFFYFSLIFIISLLLVLGFACSYFSSSLKCSIRSLI